MLVKLSIVGLPLADGIQCKPLLGFAVSNANFSNPTVALTRSLNISLTVSGSPLRKREMASLRRATENSGSC
jgi:hypothetical protein